MTKNMKMKLMALAIVPILAMGGMNCGKLKGLAKKAAAKAGYGGTKAAKEFVKKAPIFIYALTKSTQDATKFMKAHKKKKCNKKAKKKAAQINKGLKKLASLLKKKKKILTEAKSLSKIAIKEIKNKKNAVLMPDLLSGSKGLLSLIPNYKKVMANLKNAKKVTASWKKFAKKKKLKFKK